jgi:hypothetical protein
VNTTDSSELIQISYLCDTIAIVFLGKQTGRLEQSWEHFEGGRISFMMAFWDIYHHITAGQAIVYSTYAKYTTF